MLSFGCNSFITNMWHINDFFFPPVKVITQNRVSGTTVTSRNVTTLRPAPEINSCHNFYEQLLKRKTQTFTKFLAKEEHLPGELHRWKSMFFQQQHFKDASLCNGVLTVCHLESN